MAAPKKAAPPKKGAAPAPAKLPFGMRLKAWWEGYDSAELEARYAERSTPKPAAPEPPAPAPTPDAAALLGVPLPHGDAPPVPDSWSQHRLEVARLLWGEGYCGPGGAEAVIRACKLLVLSPEMSVADLNAGVGGPARALAEEFGVWVTGFTPSPTLAEAGAALSVKAGQAKQASITVLDITQPEPFERRYDRMIGEGFLSQLDDLASGLAKADAALKADGFILLSELVLEDAAALSDPDVAAWLADEPDKRHAVVLGDVEAAARTLHWMIRVNEDISADYARQITDAWRGTEQLIGELMTSAEGRVLGGVLMREAQIWNARLAALKTGKVRKRRFLIAKQPAVR